MHQYIDDCAVEELSHGDREKLHQQNFIARSVVWSAFSADARAFQAGTFYVLGTLIEGMRELLAAYHS